MLKNSLPVSWLLSKVGGGVFQITLVFIYLSICKTLIVVHLIPHFFQCKSCIRILNIVMLIGKIIILVSKLFWVSFKTKNQRDEGKKITFLSVKVKWSKRKKKMNCLQNCILGILGGESHRFCELWCLSSWRAIHNCRILHVMFILITILINLVSEWCFA